MRHGKPSAQQIRVPIVRRSERARRDLIARREQHALESRRIRRSQRLSRDETIEIGSERQCSTEVDDVFCLLAERQTQPRQQAVILDVIARRAGRPTLWVARRLSYPALAVRDA
jgi:hypothetical protein